MSTAVAQNGAAAGAIELALVSGDLSKLTPEQRLDYYRQVCDSLGLNPLTKPFDYITLNGKLTLYARKDCTEQLRAIRTISVRIMAREVVEGCYVVTARATTPEGREDESVGAVPIDGLKGEARSNAMMKAETKSKRRVTLSICGLGMLDETEVESIPAAQVPTRHAVSAKPADPHRDQLMAELRDVLTQIAEAEDTPEYVITDILCGLLQVNELGDVHTDRLPNAITAAKKRLARSQKPEPATVNGEEIPW